MKKKSKYNKLESIATSGYDTIEFEERKSTKPEIADAIINIFQLEKELVDLEQKLFRDTMKEIAGGNGFILTNSK